MSVMLHNKTLTKVLTWILIISIPMGIIYIDYVNDPYVQESGRNFIYDIELNSENTTAIIVVQDLPEFTDVNVYINFSNPNIDSRVEVLIVEEWQWNGFVDGTIPETTLDRLVEIDGEFNGWYNHTTLDEGLVRLVFTIEAPTEPLRINGLYNYVTEGYLSRNTGEIIVVTGIYIILVFGLIPQIIRRIRINRMKRRKQMERIQEEEEFYRQYNQ